MSETHYTPLPLCAEHIPAAADALEKGNHEKQENTSVPFAPFVPSLSQAFGFAFCPRVLFKYQAAVIPALLYVLLLVAGLAFCSYRLTEPIQQAVQLRMDVGCYSPSAPIDYGFSSEVFLDDIPSPHRHSPVQQRRRKNHGGHHRRSINFHAASKWVPASWLDKASRVWRKLTGYPQSPRNESTSPIHDRQHDDIHSQTQMLSDDTQSSVVVSEKSIKSSSFPTPLIHGAPAHVWAGQNPYPEAFAAAAKTLGMKSSHSETENVETSDLKLLPAVDPDNTDDIPVSVTLLPSIDPEAPVPRFHGAPVLPAVGQLLDRLNVRGIVPCHHLTEEEVEQLWDFYRGHVGLLVAAAALLTLWYFSYPLQLGVQMLAVSMARQSFYPFSAKVSLWTVPFRYSSASFFRLIGAFLLVDLVRGVVFLALSLLSFLVHRLVAPHCHSVDEALAGVGMIVRISLLAPLSCVMIAVADSVTNRVFGTEQPLRFATGLVASMETGFRIFYHAPLRFTGLMLTSLLLLVAGPLALLQLQLSNQWFLLSLFMYLYTALCIDALACGHFYFAVRADYFANAAQISVSQNDEAVLFEIVPVSSTKPQSVF